MTQSIDAFIEKWAKSGGAERANYAGFLYELCDQLGVERPDVSTSERPGDYALERPVRPRESADTAAPKRIDLYKRDAFILEAKQSRLPDAKNALPGQLSLLKDETPRGSRTAVRGWDVMMRNARKQAEGYVFLLDTEHKAPPFVIVCDVGHCFELYADFTGTGRAYTQFPDRNGYRIFLEDLRDAKWRDLLKAIWTDAHGLDPAKKAVRVTREIAARLAAVSKALEERKNNAEDVAHFLMRCLFTMFAEDTGLLPQESFRGLLQKCVERPETFALRLKQLWADMEKGVEFSHVIEARVRHFNGGLFKNTTAFELQREEIGELLAAAKADWREVDPAIFGTLLEQALDPVERRKLGAHYTPRAYVQRLVDVTVMEPLRADWEAALTKAELAKEEGKDNDAVAIVRTFHRQLCETRVLDPACGTGNFLYVALELMKQLEGEVLETLTKLGDEQGLLALKNLSVDPHLFLGLELNPRAAAIAELVVWIGYLQWHYRNTSGHPEEPILRAFENINFGKRDGYDAVLTWDGYPVPKIDMREDRHIEVYPNAKRAEWPAADFIVGNPPFIGNKRMIANLGEPYVEALRKAYADLPESIDLVMYWWDRAATSQCRRFGLVTTNSITQSYNRKVVAKHIDEKRVFSLLFAIPDHPWTKADKTAAAVRIAMTVASRENQLGRLLLVTSENDLETDTPKIKLEESLGVIESDLSIGPDVSSTIALASNTDLAHQGVTPLGEGFRLDLKELTHLGYSPDNLPPTLRKYVIGRDLVQSWETRFIIDFYGLSEIDARQRYSTLFQIILDRVKSEREQKNRESYRDNYWVFAEPRSRMREAMGGLARYIATCRTAKHRIFSFVSSEYLADAKIVAIAMPYARSLSLLSSRLHLVWALRTGGFLESRPTYQHAECFTKFPFPDPIKEVVGIKLDRLGEELDATRKRVQAEHPDITLTGLYNVLEKVKAGAELSEADEDVKARGLVLVLKDLHDQIDAATAEAYGWPADLSDEQILEKLVALNAERAKEEAAGYVRWLRPDYQIPRFAKDTPAPKTGDLDLVDAPAKAEASLPAFPKDPYEQPLAIEAALASAARPLDATELSKAFKRGGKRIEPRVGQVLLTLAKYGRVIALDGGKYAARRAA